MDLRLHEGVEAEAAARVREAEDRRVSTIGAQTELEEQVAALQRRLAERVRPGGQFEQQLLADIAQMSGKERPRAALPFSCRLACQALLYNPASPYHTHSGTQPHSSICMEAR